MSLKSSSAVINKLASKPNSNSKKDGKRKKSPSRPNKRAPQEDTILELISASLKRSDADALEQRSNASVLDRISVVQKDVSELRSTILGMETRMSLICRDLMPTPNNLRHEALRPEAIVESNTNENPVVAGDFHNLEIRLSNAESLITRLVDELAQQNQKFASRDDFRHGIQVVHI